LRGRVPIAEHVGLSAPVIDASIQVFGGDLCRAFGQDYL